jgi:two-component system response regulator RegA
VSAAAPDANATVLIVDDDVVFAQVLARALASRGFTVSCAHDGAAALAAVRAGAPRHVVLDLRIGAENGLGLIPQMLQVKADLDIVLLTGYASIATAVEAIKRGARDYLAKPVDADQVAKALEAGAAPAHQADPADPAAAHAIEPPLRRLEWEHIQRILAECGGNVSHAAQRLGLHRRTLQRKLAKRPVRESAPDVE